MTFVLALYLARAKRTLVLQADRALVLGLIVPVTFLAIRLAIFPLIRDRFLAYSASVTLIWLLSQLRQRASPLPTLGSGRRFSQREVTPGNFSALHEPRGVFTAAEAP